MAQVGYTDSGGGFSSWAGANLTNITANSWVVKQVTFTATSDYARIYLTNQWTTYCLVDAVSLGFQSSKIDIKWEMGENVQSEYPIKNTSDVYQGDSCAQFLWTAADATGNGTLVADSAWIKGGLVKTGYPVLVSNDTYDGNGSMKFLWTGLDSSYNANSLTKSSNVINLTVGQTYTFKIAFKGLINPDLGYNANQFLAQVGYTNSSGSFAGWSTASVTDNTVGAWTLHSVTFTATGSYVRVYLSNQWQTCGLIDAASIGIESKLTKSEIFELTVGQQYSFKVAFKGLNHPTYGTNKNDFYAQIGYTDSDGGLALWSGAEISDNTVGSWTVREAIFTATNSSARVFLYNNNLTYGLVDSITITPTYPPTLPAGGWQFDHWQGDINSTQNPLIVQMDTNKNVTAVFQKAAQIKTTMLRKEYQELAIALSNSTSQSRTLDIAISPANIMPTDSIVLRSSYWIKVLDSSDGYVWIDDALPRLEQNRYVTLSPGSTRRLWLTVNTTNVNAGIYEFDIVVTSTSDGKSDRVPVSIEVLPIDLEVDPNLAVFSYAYITRLSTADHKATAMQDIKAHYENTLVIDSVAVPDVDTLGNIVTQTNFAGLFDEWINLMPDAKQILFFWNWDDPYNATFKNKVTFGSVAWENAMNNWLAGWLSYLSSRNISLNRVAMYPFDETYDNSFQSTTEYSALQTVSRKLKNINSGIRVFTNPLSFNTNDLIAQIALAPYIDVWSPVQYLFDSGNYSGFPHACNESEKQAMRSFYIDQQSQNKLLWSYQCDGPMKSLSIDSYYRKFAWQCWDNNVSGLAVWSYNDIRPGTSNGSSWTDMDDEDFSMIYELRNAPTDISRQPFEPLIPSRRWQVWRASIQDYCLLQQVRRYHPERESQIQQIVSNVLSSPSAAAYESARQQLITILIGE